MKPDNHAEKNARAALEHIEEMIERYTDDNATDDQREEAEQEIYEYPLSVEVRSDWQTLNNLQAPPAEYRIMLTWGGPACQIIGELTNGQPTSAVIQHQDWFTQWEDLFTDSDQDDALLQFAQCFYYAA